LATLYLVYPGATHTRFEHSVGTFHLASKALEAIERNSKELLSRNGIDINTGRRLAVQLAALLHDVGHGPCSHLFDTFAGRNQQARIVLAEYSDRVGIKFSRWSDHMTHRLIQEGVNDYDQIPALLRRIRGELEGEGAQGAEWITPENVACLAVGSPSPAATDEGYLAEIVASDYDVDPDRDITARAVAGSSDGGGQSCYGLVGTYGTRGLQGKLHLVK